MTKSIVLKIISIVSAVLAVIAIACAITVKGSGFLDLSNIARAVFTVLAIVFGVLAILIWMLSAKQGTRKRKK